MRYFTQVGNAESSILIGPDGNPFKPFELYKKRLSDNKISHGTIND